MKISQLNQFPDRVCHVPTHAALLAQRGEGNGMLASLKTVHAREKTSVEPSLRNSPVLAWAERRACEELTPCKGRLLPRDANKRLPRLGMRLGLGFKPSAVAWPRAAPGPAGFFVSRQLEETVVLLCASFNSTLLSCSLCHPHHKPQVTSAFGFLFVFTFQV